MFITHYKEYIGTTCSRYNYFMHLFTALDPFCPPNQQGMVANVDDYMTFTWTPPPNVDIDKSSFRGASEVSMKGGTSYLFTNEYTDGNGNTKVCTFTASVSGR